MASDSPMRETWVKKNEPGIGAFVPARMERLGIIRGSAAAGLTRRSE
jgi:hypothetical protein